MTTAGAPSGDDCRSTDVLGAARVLAGGGLVAFPTETVYGLGARADDDRAVEAIFAAKGRPTDHPLIVHVAGPDQARTFAASMPGAAQRLVTAFWPGPLTIIVPRATDVASGAAAGHPGIGLRCPSHPVARALLGEALALGVPGVAAPSANRFGRISPTTAQHVREEFGPELCVLDGGPCAVGIESAIVDCTGEQAVLLRPGTLERSTIEAVAGDLRAPGGRVSHAAPGTLEAHYAPRARLRMMPAAALSAALADLPAPASALAVYSRSVPASRGRPSARLAAWRIMPDDATAAARQLFAALRELDRSGVAEIWVEAPPGTPEWDGVRDRLQRAAAAR